MRATLPLLLGLLALTCLEGAAPPRPQHAEARRLIRQLGHEDYEMRVSAREGLLRLEPPDEVLREATESADLETSRAARSILAILTSRRTQRTVSPLRAHARAMEADLFAERFLLWEGADDLGSCWQCFLDLNWNFLDYDNRVRPPKDKQEWAKRQSQERSFPRRVFGDHVLSNRDRIQILPPGKPALTLRYKGPPLRRVRHEIVARTERANIEGLILNSLVVCSGSVELDQVGRCFILCAGEVRIKGSCNDSVVICGGDAYVAGGHSSLVVVRGSIKGLERARETCLRAGGDVLLTKSGFAIEGEIHAAGKVIDPANTRSKEKHKFVDNSPLATDFVRFFELRRVGLEVVAAKGGVEVARVSEGRSFATAGVRKGDLIVQCGREAVESPETLRRMIRKRVALGAPAQLTLRRDNKEMSVRVVLD